MEIYPVTFIKLLLSYNLTVQQFRKQKIIKHLKFESQKVIILTKVLASDLHGNLLVQIEANKLS